MTKSEHKALASQLAWQVRNSYSKEAKKKAVNGCLKHLIESLKG